MRIVLSLALLFFVVTAFGLYRVADNVQAMEREIRTANRAIVEERQAIRVLEAEWAYLNNPARIQALTEEFLVLAQPDGRQVISFTKIPAQDRVSQLPAPVIPVIKPQAPEAMVLASYQNVSSTEAVENVMTSLPVVTSSYVPVQPKFKPAIPAAKHASASTTVAVTKFEEMMARLKFQGTRGDAE